MKKLQVLFFTITISFCATSQAGLIGSKSMPPAAMSFIDQLIAFFSM